MKLKRFNGTGEIIVQAISNEKINGIEYQAGDIVSFIREAEVYLDYEQVNKESSSTKRESSYSDFHPNRLILSRIPNSKEVENLLYTKKGEETVKTFMTQTVEFAAGEVFLDTQDSVLEVKVFSEGKPIDVVFNQDANSITFDKTYKDVEIIILLLKSSLQYILKKPEFGYFNITIVIDGKIGENSGKFMLNIPKANLITEPSFDLSEDSYGTELTFEIVDSKYTPVVSYIGDN